MKTPAHSKGLKSSSARQRVLQSPLLGKGAAHGKSKKARRAADKVRVRKGEIE